MKAAIRDRLNAPTLVAASLPSLKNIRGRDAADARFGRDFRSVDIHLGDPGDFPS
jgi:hypothetical protein